MLGSRPRNKEN